MKRLPHLLALCIAPLCFAAGTDKRGGVCFRTDDNHTPAKWKQLRAVFDKHGCKLCAALNFGTVAGNKEYMAFVRDLQAGGHEVMDHTAGHRVFQLRLATAEQAAGYADKPFVDHVSGRILYFSYRVQPVRSAHRGKATVAGRSFRPADPAKFRNWRGVPHLVFADAPETVYLLTQTKAGDFELRSFWGENTVDLGAERTVAYRRLCKEDIRVPPEAMRMQAQVVRDICKAHGVQLPTTWIQPGGYEATLWRDDVALVYGREFGYTAGATYPDSSLKCFNEYDPDDDRRFAMQWGNFMEDGRDLAWNKTRIADGVARHYVMTGHSHMNGPAKLNGWAGTLERTEAILAWCRETGIPVRTMSEWADILYSQETDPTVNVFPDTGMDRDGNGRPDGLSLGPGVTVDKADGKAFLMATRDGVVCKVEKLGGIEKGGNEFSVEIPAGIQATIELKARFPGLKQRKQTVILTPADPAHMGRISGIIEVPEQASVVDLSLSARGASWPLRLAQPCLRARPR